MGAVSFLALALLGEGDRFAFGDLFELRLLGERDVFRLVPISERRGFGEDALLFWLTPAVCFGVVVRGLGDEVFDLGLADIFCFVLNLNISLL